MREGTSLLPFTPIICQSTCICKKLWTCIHVDLYRRELLKSLAYLPRVFWTYLACARSWAPLQRMSCLRSSGIRYKFAHLLVTLRTQTCQCMPFSLCQRWRLNMCYKWETTRLYSHPTIFRPSFVDIAFVKDERTTFSRMAAYYWTPALVSGWPKYRKNGSIPRNHLSSEFLFEGALFLRAPPSLRSSWVLSSVSQTNLLPLTIMCMRPRRLIIR